VSDASVAGVYGDILERAAAIAPAGGGPYLALNMVSSADGAISVDGVSAGLSGSADKDVFFYLRSLADVILVGAATAREENYGQPRLSPELVAEREARGQTPLPRIAVITNSGQMDWSARLFHPAVTTPPAQRPVVICPGHTPEDRRAAAERVADVIIAGDSDVDLASAMAQLGEQGARFVLCEGGPTINGFLLSAGLVDELCLTLSPALVGGRGQRVSGWADAHLPLGLELLTLAEVDGVLMLRYAISR
jgi:riboflavin biosynthesis pyrimidine reductase